MNRQKNSVFIITITEINHPGILCYVGQNSYHSGYLSGHGFSSQTKTRDEITAFNFNHNLANANTIQIKSMASKAYFQNMHDPNPVFGMNLKNLWMSPKLIEFWHNVQIDH
ncbi:MAG: hypothetical protein IPL08_17290 [Saprospiraceae bacterium]|nr:hypothetical protein [Saprospiraceae bacterium]